MYINFWYPMAVGEELADSPVPVRCMGLDFVLFRDGAGQARCLSNTCVHRGGSLAGGKVAGDCVQCPYHGWQYDGDGVCTRIPTLPDGAGIPDRAFHRLCGLRTSRPPPAPMGSSTLRLARCLGQRSPRRCVMPPAVRGTQRN